MFSETFVYLGQGSKKHHITMEAFVGCRIKKAVDIFLPYMEKDLDCYSLVRDREGYIDAKKTIETK